MIVLDKKYHTLRNRIESTFKKLPYPKYKNLDRTVKNDCYLMREMSENLKYMFSYRIRGRKFLKSRAANVTEKKNSVTFRKLKSTTQSLEEESPRKKSPVKKLAKTQSVTGINFFSRKKKEVKIKEYLDKSKASSNKLVNSSLVDNPNDSTLKSKKLFDASKSIEMNSTSPPRRRRTRRNFYQTCTGTFEQNIYQVLDVKENTASTKMIKKFSKTNPDISDSDKNNQIIPPKIKTLRMKKIKLKKKKEIPIVEEKPLTPKSKYLAEKAEKERLEAIVNEYMAGLKKGQVTDLLTNKSYKERQKKLLENRKKRLSSSEKSPDNSFVNTAILQNNSRSKVLSKESETSKSGKISPKGTIMKSVNKELNPSADTRYLFEKFVLNNSTLYRKYQKRLFVKLSKRSEKTLDNFKKEEAERNMNQKEADFRKVHNDLTDEDKYGLMKKSKDISESMGQRADIMLYGKSVSLPKKYAKMINYADSLIKMNVVDYYKKGKKEVLKNYPNIEFFNKVRVDPRPFDMNEISLSQARLDVRLGIHSYLPQVLD